MKNSISILLLGLFTYCGFSQQYEIEYNHITTFDAHTTEAIYKLAYANQKSTYFQLKSEFIESLGNDVMVANEGVIPFVEKDYSKKRVVYNQPIVNKIVFIEDQLPMQKWKITNESKKIKDFNCRKATTSFRGRAYTAWFTEDIPIINGPWKFDGLPGLILEVVSSDGVLNIEAVKIEKTSHVTTPIFKYKEDALMAWEDYCQNYRKVIDRIQKNMMADTDPDVEYNITLNLVEDIGL
ncbi:GLPGLI family protein [Sungkyunkwania multivorans]|uniref:GLPGLI family protein n=1 Tax=Sungkyunkwania multivorans TaxID=1173618 RepID=A0ABW3CT23_9FLAO